MLPAVIRRYPDGLYAKLRLQPTAKGQFPTIASLLIPRPLLRVAMVISQIPLIYQIYGCFFLCCRKVQPTLCPSLDALTNIVSVFQRERNVLAFRLAFYATACRASGRRMIGYH